MKSSLNDMRMTALLILALLIAMLSGCARSPEGSGIAAVRAFTVELALAAPVNDDFYYYMVIDADGGGAGPVPVFPGNAPGQGWVTGSATHFVEYHRGQFTLYKFLNLDQFQYVQVGTPIRFSAQGQTLGFTIDLNDLGVAGESIDANFITLDSPFNQHRVLDALYPASSLNIDITRDNPIDNARLGFPEQPDDLLNENGITQPSTDLTRPLDMTGWSIAVDI